MGEYPIECPRDDCESRTFHIGDEGLIACSECFRRLPITTSLIGGAAEGRQAKADAYESARGLGFRPQDE